MELKTDTDKYTYRYRYIFFIKTMYIIFLVIFILFFPEVNNIKALEMEYVETEHKFLPEFLKILCKSHYYISVYEVKVRLFREVISYNLYFIQPDQ